jgi:hypothetical protein
MGEIRNQAHLRRLGRAGGLAITADEAVTMLPAGPTGRHKRTLTRLYTLVGRTAGQATAVLELGEELVDLHEAIKP